MISVLASVIVFLIENFFGKICVVDALEDLLPNRKDINYVFFIIFIAIFLLYIVFPVYYMWGRRDPSVYFLMGTNIARNGSLVMPTNDLINQMYEEIKDFAELNFRGFYPEYLYELGNWSGDYSAIQAQFLHVFSSAIAIGYSLYGIEGMVRVPAFIGAMAILAIYNFVSFFIGKKYGTFAALLMGLCPAQIWGARITQTEELCQWIYILVALLFAYAVKETNNKLILVLVGVLLGLSNLIRIDACILGFGLLLCACILNIFRKETADWNVMAISYTVITVPAFLIDLKCSMVYISKHQSYICPVLVVSILLVLLNIWVRRSRLIEKSYGVALKKIKDYKIKPRKLFLLVTTIMLLLFKYLWFIRPLNQNGINASYDFWQRCFIEIFNYIPLVFYLLFFVGIFFLLSEMERFKGIELFTIIGIVSTCIYIYKPSIAPDHIWASRRWVTSVFPFIVIIAVFGLCLIEERLKGKRVLGAAISFGVVLYSAGFMLNQSSSFLFKPMLKDMMGKYEELADNMDDDKLYFVEMSHFGAYLRFLYGKNVVVLNLENEEAFYDYVSNIDSDVFFIGDINSLKYMYNYDIIYQGEIKGTYVKQDNYVLTGELYEVGTITNIYELSIEK
jgi:hypothetical protein